MTIDRETLAAYAEGQLGAAETARVEAAIAADPALAKDVAAHRALRDRLQAHFATVLDMPVPDRLLDAVKSAPTAEVIDLSAARKAKARTLPSRWIMGGAIAASLAIGLILGTQVSDGGPVGGASGQLVAQGALDKALTTQLASAESAQVRVPLSFRNEDGRYCRVFDTGTMAGIACRGDNAWIIDRMQSGGKGADTQYRQAGSALGEIMAAAQNMARQEALLPQEEAAARNRGWK